MNESLLIAGFCGSSIAMLGASVNAMKSETRLKTILWVFGSAAWFYWMLRFGNELLLSLR